MAKVRLPSVLRPLAGGAATIPAEAGTLRDLASELRARYPALAERVCVEDGFGEFVSVFVDGEDARHLAGEVTLQASTEVTLLPAISGG
jgi:molybdopterin synthase sulfur carrier subunit